jgi:hypothetical protein
MGVLKMITETLTRSDNPADLQAEAEEQRAVWRRALDEVDALEARKGAAASASELAEIQNAIAWQRVLADKAAKQITVTESRLKAAQAAVQDKLRAELLAPWSPAMAAYFGKAEEFLKMFSALVGIKTQLEVNGFRTDAAALILPPHIGGSPLLARDLLDRAKAEQERAMSPSARKPPTPAPPAATPSAKPKQLDRSRMVGGNDGDARPQHAPPLPDELEPLKPGEVRVRVMESGYPDRHGKGCQGRRLIILPQNIAQVALMNHAVDIVERGPPEEPPRAGQQPYPSTDAKIGDGHVH